MDLKENYNTPDKIQDLFNLIDFFDENKAEFRKYNANFFKSEAISKQMADLTPLDHYTKRLRYNELENKEAEIYSPILKNVIQPIKQKVQQLEITNFSDAADMKALMFNKYFHAITDYVKKISSESEADNLNNYKNKYLAFRTNATYKHSFGLSFFFDALDELLTELFKEFKDADNFTELCFFEPRLREVSKWTNKDHYNHYLKTKRFFDFSLLSKRDNKDFDELKDQLNKQNDVYKYIASKLDRYELIEFKNDYEQRLKNAKDKQDLNKHKVLINYFIDQLNKEPQEADQSKQGNNKADKPIISDLKDLFFDNDKYTEVMQILADNGYIYEDTGYWIETKTGYKGFAASLVKNHLHAKGYLKQKPENDEVILILKNTFGVNVGIDTVKRANTNIVNYSFIPPNVT